MEEHTDYFVPAGHDSDIPSSSLVLIQGLLQPLIIAKILPVSGRANDELAVKMMMLVIVVVVYSPVV